MTQLFRYLKVGEPFAEGDFFMESYVPSPVKSVSWGQPLQPGDSAKYFRPVSDPPNRRAMQILADKNIAQEKLIKKLTKELEQLKKIANEKPWREVAADAEKIKTAQKFYNEQIQKIKYERDRLLARQHEAEIKERNGRPTSGLT